MTCLSSVWCPAVLAGYRRVSFVGGRKGESFRSPIDQAAEIEAWAERNGHRVAMLEAELDRKGSDAERPIFREAVEGVAAGRFTGVVVAYLSRAGRDLRLMLDLWDEVESAGGAVYSARENIDGSTVAGRLHRNLLASIHQHELEERREGFAHSTAAAVADGIWPRRQAPRGYRRDERRRLVTDDRAGDVREAAGDFLAGTTIRALAGRLAMTSSGVRYMLRNRVYLGEVRVGEHVNPAAHEPILDLATFEAVQAKLADRSRPARSGPPALLAGLVRCASCGHVMTRGSSKGGSAYICPAYHSGERCPGPTSIGCSRVEPYVEAIALRELERLQSAGSAGDAVTAARQQVDIDRAELQAYLTAVAAAGIGAADAAEGMRVRQRRLERSEATLRQEMARAPQLPQIQGGREVYLSLGQHERNQFLRSLLACVIVRRAGRGRTVAVAERCRVLRYGADIVLPGSTGEVAGGIVPLWENGDGEDLPGVLAGEDAL